MNIRVQKQALRELSGDLIVIPVAQGEHSNGTIQEIDKAVSGALKEQITRSGFVGKEGETLLFPTQGRLLSRTVLLIGVGKSESRDNSVRRAPLSLQSGHQTDSRRGFSRSFKSGPRSATTDRERQP